MSDDIIIIVPPGTRVRYVENPYLDGKIYVMDASALQPTTFEFEPLDTFAKLSSVPIYDAESTTMSDRYGVPEPTGSWYVAIESLREVHALMEFMKVDEPSGEVSLGEVFQRQIEAMIGSIDQHWRWSYMKVALATPKIVIPEDEAERYGIQVSEAIWLKGDDDESRETS